MSDYQMQNARKLGALQGAAEWARDVLNGTISFPDQEAAIKSALDALHLALDHDGSENYVYRRASAS